MGVNVSFFCKIIETVFQYTDVCSLNNFIKVRFIYTNLYKPILNCDTFFQRQNDCEKGGMFNFESIISLIS